jgi:hypothetical protein
MSPGSLARTRDTENPDGDDAQLSSERPTAAGTALCDLRLLTDLRARHTAAAMIADSLRIPSGITASSTLLNERRSWFRP